MKKILFSLWVLIPVIAYCQTFSTLKIDLGTSGAVVRLDNVVLSETVLAGKLTVAAGKHRITAVKQGYIPFEAIMDIRQGEHKNISIVLVKDTRSHLTITSATPSTNLRINGEPEIWDSSQKLEKLLFQDSYEFEFSESGLIAARQTVKFESNSNYNMKVILRAYYPAVSPEEIGRQVKKNFTERDFYKPVTKSVRSDTKTQLGATLTAILFGAVAGAVTKGQDDSFYWIMGTGIVGYFGYLSVSEPEYKSVPDNENIQYNKNVVPNLVHQKNLEVESYNMETRRLIEEEQKKRYQQNAIVIEKLNQVK